MAITNGTRYIIWDFDGTLAYRPGMWSGTLVEVLRREIPGSSFTVDQIRPYMQTGFPWNHPEQPQTPERMADEWWESLHPVFERAFREGAGLNANEARRLALHVRPVYVDPNAWKLFDDAVPSLNLLREAGWRHVILSNHVPELPDLIEALGISPLIDQIFNSAQTGFEKPHPEAFARVLNAIRGATEYWMVGDNVSADIEGAAAMGLPAVLVRSRDSRAKHCCQTLTELAELLNDTGAARAAARRD